VPNIVEQEDSPSEAAIREARRTRFFMVDLGGVARWMENQKRQQHELKPSVRAAMAAKVKSRVNMLLSLDG
jgi:hypothetical protein